MLWVVVALASLATLGLLFAALYVADSLTGGRRMRVQGTPADLGVRYEEVQFLTADRLTLRGWFMAAPAARATVILVHDVGTTRADRERGMLRLQRDYIRRGFSVFAFDLRAHGESGGKRDTLGSNERLDVQAAVAYVRRRTGKTPILLHGFGYGAGLVVDALGRGVDVAGAIADSPFTTMRSYLRAQYRGVPGPIFQVAMRVAHRLFGCDASTLNPIQAITKVTVPVLFVHSAGDDVIPAAHTLNLSAASLDPRMRVWVVDDHIGHGTAYVDFPDAYMEHSLRFIDEIVPARTHFSVSAEPVSEAV